MRKMMFCLIFFILSINIFGNDKPKSFGIVFNIENILLDLESFNGGVGIKYVNNLNGFRGLAGFYYTNHTLAYSLDLGISYQRYFWLKRVSPYYGFTISGGLLTQTDETDGENWTKNKTYTYSFGPILGAEIFIFDFLSIFAEYSLIFEANGTKSGTRTDGTENWEDLQWSYLIETDIGNNSKIGITIYFSKLIDFTNE